MATEGMAESTDRFVAAVIQLIAERGLGDFTLADVGRVAGVSRGLASHYASKDKLIRKALERLLTPPAPSGSEGLRPLLTSARVAFDKAISQSIDARALHVVLGHVETNFVHRDLCTEFIDRRVARVEGHLAAGIKAGEIRPVTDLKACAQVVVSLVGGAVRDALAISSADDRTLARQALVECLSRFLAAD